MHRVLFEQPPGGPVWSVSPGAGYRGSTDLDETSGIHPFQNAFRPPLQDPLRSGCVTIGIIPALRSLNSASFTWGGIPLVALLDQQVLLRGNGAARRMSDYVFNILK